MKDPARIKSAVLSSGADICGIAPAVRFIDAPDGFRPKDVYPGCNSVMVFGRKVPSSILEAASCAAYTHASHLVAREVDRITLEACRRLESEGLVSVPVPTDDPYEYWDAEKMRGMGILSLRHAGFLAGLGVIGRNTLLVNRRLGNMMQLGAILVDAELQGDPVIHESYCPRECRICIEECPQKALDGRTVDQRLCRPLSNFRNPKGYTLKKCNLCRKVCPNRFGVAEARAGKKRTR
ncbi:MAG: epoxyqueuosine reductase [Euryarchaeota archaeon]|nr:epoxyqueuosine reductase [Euryarchaeota archaeon]